MLCEPQPYTPLPCTICPPPEVVSPCLNGEPCLEITDAQCVGYSGEELAAIGVLTGDRLDVILRKLNINNGSASVVVEDTFSVDITGSGLTSNKLKANVVLDAVADNLLKVTTDGLKVQYTKANLLALLQMIEDDVDLQLRFCQVAANCGANTCGIPTGITATMI